MSDWKAGLSEFMRGVKLEEEKADAGKLRMDARALEYIVQVATPALEEVKAELQRYGRKAEVQRTDGDDRPDKPRPASIRITAEYRSWMELDCNVVVIGTADPDRIHVEAVVAAYYFDRVGRRRSDETNRYLIPCDDPTEPPTREDISAYLVGLFQQEVARHME